LHNREKSIAHTHTHKAAKLAGTTKYLSILTLNWIGLNSSIKKGIDWKTALKRKI
jgi:uncharacterized membrane protein